MPRTVLVLTATGTTGSATVAALLRAGATVRAATRDPAGAAFPAGATPVAWSFDDPSTWAPALAGVDALYLACPGWLPDEVEVADAILDAARAAGVTRVVKLSAAGVENNPASSHRRVEVLIEGSGLAWVHLRPTFFAENFIESYGGPIRSEGAIYLPAGGGRTGFIAASDIGEAAAVALLGEQSGEAWTLTGPESLDHAEVAAILTEVLGRPIRYVDIPPEAFAAALRQHGVSELGVSVMDGLYGMVRAGWTAELSPDVERVTGRTPTRFRDWAAAHAGAWG